MGRDQPSGGLRYSSWGLACLVALLVLVWGCGEAPAPSPNFLIILADDLGYGGIGAFGHEQVRTPHLDALSEEGLTFYHFYANAPVCTPTRAALLTGNYQQRSGLEGVIYVRWETRQVGLDTSEVTLAERLKARGYATGIMGKWHLGYKKEYNPVQQGFDEFYGYVSGNVDYHSHYDNAGIFDWWHNLDTLREEGYVTDLITEHAVDFIEQHSDEPFFLYVPHEAPHVPFQSRTDTAYRYPNRDFSYYGPVEDTAATYNAMIEAMDEGVGHIMEALRAHGLEENTLVFFLSDNGGERFGDNGPLSGFKGGLREGGIRVPAIAYWKGRIEPGESYANLMSMDLYPTLLKLAGAKPFDTGSVDGEDFSEILLDQDLGPVRPLFWRYRGQRAVVEGPWKLHLTPTDTSLYHLTEDPAETTDRSEEEPQVRAMLLMQLITWEDGLEAPLKTE